MSKVYRTQDSGGAEAPDYVILDGRFYRTVHHPDGWSDSDLFRQQRRVLGFMRLVAEQQLQRMGARRQILPDGPPPGWMVGYSRL